MYIEKSYNDYITIRIAVIDGRLEQEVTKSISPAWHSANSRVAEFESVKKDNRLSSFEVAAISRSGYPLNCRIPKIERERQAFSIPNLNFTARIAT